MMRYDVICPYCGNGQDINHDDGYGYSEDVVYEQSCDCGKQFAYRTSIMYSYEAIPAPCMNGEPHDWRLTHTQPKYFTQMQCKCCEERRELTIPERIHFNIPLEYTPDPPYPIKNRN